MSNTIAKSINICIYLCAGAIRTGRSLALARWRNSQDNMTKPASSPRSLDDSHDANVCRHLELPPFQAVPGALLKYGAPADTFTESESGQVGAQTSAREELTEEVQQEAVDGPTCASLLADESLDVETRLQILAQYDPGGVPVSDPSLDTAKTIDRETSTCEIRGILGSSWAV